MRLYVLNWPTQVQMNSSYHHHQSSSTSSSPSSSSNRKYQSFPLLSYFSVAVCLRWLYHHMLSVPYIHHYHHYAELSECILLLKCLWGIFCLECVSKIWSTLSIIFHAIYGAVRIQHIHFFYDDCEITCTLFCYHHQIGSITHLPLFMVRSWINGMHYMAFIFLWYSYPDSMHHCTSVWNNSLRTLLGC